MEIAELTTEIFADGKGLDSCWKGFDVVGFIAAQG